MPRTILLHRVEYALFRSLLLLLDLLGSRVVAMIGCAVARLVVFVLPARWSRTDVARENVRQSFEGLDERRVTSIVLGMWEHAVRVFFELSRAHRLRERDVEGLVEWTGDWEANERLLLESGRPIIELGGHLGSWEIGSILCGLSECRMSIVARRLDNPLLDGWFRRLRERTGHELLDKKTDYDRIVERLESGGRVAMLCDQDAGPKGVFVPFLGRPASTVRSIALLAIRHRAYVCVGYCCRIPSRNGEWTRLEMGCEEVIDAAQYDDLDGVERLTRRYTECLERVVRRFPEQYFWVHRRWKTPPRRPAVRSRAA